ncbi:MAG: hypothetical protein GX444_05780 [Myxococcales bacterium]|nr:hypothetical protein [Myxococcales bacterium]
MAFPELYLSKPAIVLPAKKIDNDELLDLIRINYRGAKGDYPVLEKIVEKIFEQCGSETRYIETDPTVRVAEYAIKAAQACLAANGLNAGNLDLLINGSIAREYFEPSTAMEIAAGLGIEEIHAFDVTSACAGSLEAVHIAGAYFNLHDHFQNALVCSAELTRNFLSYAIQSVPELVEKAAGLTIGNAAAAWAISRRPFPGGCLRIRAARNYSLPRHWHLCTTPIDGTFTSMAGELFKLSVHVAPELRRVLAGIGWSAADVDHFVFHQPSEKMVQAVMYDLEAAPEKAVYSHHLYGNTSSTTVALALHQLLKERDILNGQKLLLSTAASGFTMVTIAGEWVE